MRLSCMQSAPWGLAGTGAAPVREERPRCLEQESEVDSCAAWLARTRVGYCKMIEKLNE